MPSSLIAYALFGSVAALALVGTRSASGVVGGVPEPQSKRQKRFRCAFAATGLGDDWMRFFEQTAYRESKFRRTALNSSPGEVAAADKINDKFGYIDGINFGSSKWEFGSKGLFQFLGVVVALKGGRLRFPVSMTNPNMAYNPGISMAAALSYAGGLMGWNNFEGSWASLNVGWGNPSKMGNKSAIATSARKMEDRAAQLGWARGWSRQRVTALPALNQNQMAALANTAKAYYDAC